MSDSEIKENNVAVIESPDADIRESQVVADSGNMEQSQEKEHGAEFLALEGYAGGVMKKNIDGVGSKLVGMLTKRYGARAVGMAGHAMMAGLGAMTGADLAGRVSGDIILIDAMDSARRSKALEKIMAKKEWVGAAKQKCAGMIREKLFSAKGSVAGIAS